MKATVIAFELHIYDKRGGGFLTCDLSEIPTVKACILARYNDFSSTPNILHQELNFGGCTFIADEQYGDFCIMSGDVAGIGLLKLIHSELTTTD